MAIAAKSGGAAFRPVTGDRIAARLSVIGGAPSAVVTSPEPLWTGDAAAARRLASGIFLFGGAVVDAPGKSPWDQTAPTAAWSDALQGFDWVDDLVAASEPETSETLKGWVHDWIDRYGAGAGPGWRPDLTGRRLTRWICHAVPLLNGAGAARSRAFFRAIGRQTRFLRRRWRSASPGLPRFEAAAGLIYAGLALEGAGGATIKEGIAALGAEAKRHIGERGGLPSRSPLDVAEAFAILVWARQSLLDAGLAPAPEHEAALPRLAAAIRALRHGDGALARFHGGGGGDPERIDRALAASGLRPGDPIHESMGLHRLATGRTVIVFDAGARPTAGAARTAHASAFCFEASIGRDPLIVNCGPGARFGDRWRQAARATAAHSGLTIDDMSSSRAGADGALTAGAREISCMREDDASAVRLIAQHDGYLKTHGLIHQRRLSLSADGGDFQGEDRVFAEGPGPRAVFDQATGRDHTMRAPFTIRFHLHPDVAADVFLAGGAVRLRTPAGAIWIMRQLGGTLTIEDGAYLDESRVTPRATKQIVVRGYAADYRGQVKWSFRRAEPDRRDGGQARA